MIEFYYFGVAGMLTAVAAVSFSALSSGDACTERGRTVVMAAGIAHAVWGLVFWVALVVGLFEASDRVCHALAKMERVRAGKFLLRLLDLIGVLGAATTVLGGLVASSVLVGLRECMHTRYFIAYGMTMASDIAFIVLYAVFCLCVAPCLELAESV